MLFGIPTPTAWVYNLLPNIESDDVDFFEWDFWEVAFREVCPEIFWQVAVIVVHDWNVFEFPLHRGGWFLGWSGW